MKSYRDLDIFIESRRLAIEIHKLTLTLPKFELYEEGSQVRRSSKAVTIAIVEGYGRRRYKADYIKHLIYAQTECYETINHLDFLFQTKSMANTAEYERITKEYDVVSMKINRFIQWVENNL